MEAVIFVVARKTNYSPEEIIIAFTSELVGTDEGSPEGIAPDMSSLTLNHSLLPPFQIMNKNKFQKIDNYSKNVTNKLSVKSQLENKLLHKISFKFVYVLAQCLTSTSCKS